MSDKPYLKRLLIKQFRNVRPGTEIFFNPGYNIFLGKNGTGKTTLLEIISCFMRRDFSKFANDEFNLELETSNRDILTAQSNIPINSNQSTWTINISPLDKSLATALNTFYQNDRNAIFCNPFERFDESLDIFQRMINQTHPEHVKIDIRFLPKKSIWASFLPSSILNIFLNAHETDMENFKISHTKEQTINMLSQFTKLLELNNAEIIFANPEIIPTNGANKYIFDAMSFNFYFKNGHKVPHTKLSYGQKRLLAFLYYIECNESMIIADEMSNGFHYDWIKECMDLIKDRQCFLSSQNPILLDHLSFEDKSEIQHTFVKCEFDEQYRIVWSNFTDDDVDDFWGAYQVRIQEVSEILRAKGLW